MQDHSSAGIFLMVLRGDRVQDVGAGIFYTNMRFDEGCLFDVCL